MDNKTLLDMRYSLDTISFLLKYQLDSFKQKINLRCHRNISYSFLDVSAFVNELEISKKFTIKEKDALLKIRNKLEYITSRKNEYFVLEQEEGKNPYFPVTLYYDLHASKELFKYALVSKIDIDKDTDKKCKYEMCPRVEGEYENVRFLHSQWSETDLGRMEQIVETYETAHKTIYGDWEKTYTDISFVKYLSDCKYLLCGINSCIFDLRKPFDHNYSNEENEENEEIASFLVRSNRIKKNDKELFCDIMNGIEKTKKVNWLYTQEDLKIFALYIQEAIYKDPEAKVIPVKKGGPLKLNELNRFFTVKGRTLTKGRHDISIQDLYDFFKCMNKIKD